MRKQDVTTEDYTGKIEYPESWLFAFNEQYINITLDESVSISGTLTIKRRDNVVSNSLDFALYDGKASIYCAKLFQLLFADIEKQRAIDADIIVKLGTETILNATTTAIWGKMRVGDQFCSFGDFVNNGTKVDFERHIVWFTELPFQLSCFRRTSDENIKAIIGTTKIKRILPSMEIGEDNYIIIDAPLENRPFRCDIMVDDESDVPESSGRLYGNIVRVVLFTKPRYKYYILVSDEWIDATESQYNAETNENKRYKVSEGGAILAYDSNGEYGDSWDTINVEDGISTQWGCSDDYILNNESTSIRTDAEWNLNGDIVRWDAKNSELVKVAFGNSNDTGIFEINPNVAFMVDRIKDDGYGTYIMIDGERHWVTEKVPTIEISWNYKTTGVFDETFDFTFDTTYIKQQLTERIILEKRSEQVGYYLRWIDRFGYVNYFLFVKGENVIKTTASSYDVSAEYDYNGLVYDARRNMSVESETTIKCSAVNLTQSMLAYVSSIVESPYVDLYEGKSKSGREVWTPINIASGSYKSNPKVNLQDFEITFSKGKNTTQSL